MFNPSLKEVRKFFYKAWSKNKTLLPLTPIESIVVSWIKVHPEFYIQKKLFNEELLDFEKNSSLFLHLSLHLAVSEQLLINQPFGIKNIYKKLLFLTNSEHDAHHKIFPCLEEILLEAQLNNTTPDTELYLSKLKKLI